MVIIKQLYGIRAAYEITLEINNYFGPHNSFGVDQVTIEMNTGITKIIDLKHTKDTFHSSSKIKNSEPTCGFTVFS
ncbi:DUF3888 domain-containing protein [Lysinibacillus parviboronicapiens]|uniref:DUF3888 domain-containing protein n=1 Tax=Lysinibacillus parviboronicapiens TaxID=436516 RepID=UPI000D3D6CA0